MIEKPKTAKAAHSDMIRSLPGWVGHCRMRIRGNVIWLHIEPSAAIKRMKKKENGQIVVALPAQRYMVEIRDIASGAWISRESAAGGPLVAGLPCTGSALDVRISPVGAGKPGN